MDHRQHQPLNRKKVISSIVVVSALAGAGYAVKRLSADPTGQKDCPPVFADEADSSNTQVNVEIAPLSTGDLLK